jgi:hypothetical protein
MRRIALPILCLILGIQAAGAQEIQNTLSYRNISSDHYFRVNYENDLFFHTDYYYTQGVHFELVSPKISRLPTRFLFPALKKYTRRYGIGLESAGYTPRTIFADSILVGDRPFAGLAYGKAFMLATNEAARSRFSAVFILGLMGPAAGGYEIQSYIHRYTGNPDPLGWTYQVKNEVVINYEVDYEKAITRPNDHLMLSACGMARLGTLSTKVAAGLVLMGGWLNDPFRVAHEGRKWTAYAYLHPAVEAIGYDATLQGGPFTTHNPYVIPSEDISRVTFRGIGGIMLGYGRVSLGGSVRYLTKEFRTGASHLTGGFQLGISF